MSQSDNFHPLNISTGSEMVCPLLGARDDLETRFAYPSSGNYCHRVTPIESIDHAHQEAVCLTSDYVTCPVYQEQWKGPLPPGIRGKEISAGYKPRIRRLLIALVILVMAAGGILGVWYLYTQGWMPGFLGTTETSQETEAALLLAVASVTPSPTASPLASSTPTMTDTLEPTFTNTPNPSPTDTLTPTPTNTPPPTPGPGLGTPFGVDKVYAIHWVQEGQSLVTIARLYDTTEEVIRAANAILDRRTTWPDDILVIPAGEKDPANVRRFEYLFVGKKTDIQALAQELAEQYQYPVSADEIRAFNNLGENPWIPAGRWLIIPVSEP
jgi:hypothetical protein